MSEARKYVEYIDKPRRHENPIRITHDLGTRDIVIATYSETGTPLNPIGIVITDSRTIEIWHGELVARVVVIG